MSAATNWLLQTLEYHRRVARDLADPDADPLASAGDALAYLSYRATRVADYRRLAEGGDWCGEDLGEYDRMRAKALVAAEEDHYRAGVQCLLRLGLRHGIDASPLLRGPDEAITARLLAAAQAEARKRREAEDAAAAEPEAGSGPALALARLLSGGVADDRIRDAARLLADGALTANEKLVGIDQLIPLPASASAEQLGEMLGVSKQAVTKTDWWTRTRKGERASEVGRRREARRGR